MNRQKILSLIHRITPIGLKVTRQKIKYSENELDSIKSVYLFFEDLNKIINWTFLSDKDNDRVALFFLNSLLLTKKLEVISVFCPSYKKNKNEFGYSSNIGTKTKLNIEMIHKVLKLATKYGISASATIYFSDLILENYSRLKFIDYKSQLKSNFHDLKMKVPPTFSVKLLSSLGDLNNQIGEIGPDEPLIDINNKDFEIVLNRNRLFYKDCLGWKEPEIIERTFELTKAYPYIANAINKEYGGAIYFWSESAKERLRLMRNLKLPVIISR